MRKALLALLVVVATPVLSTGLAGGPARAADGTDPAGLPRGADAHVTWLGGTTLHTRSGHDRGLPFPAARAPYLRLLGRSHGSWVVADLGGTQAATSRVLRVHHGRYRTVLTVDNYYDRPTYQLARGGDQIVTWDYDRGGTTSSVYSWQGRLLAQRYQDGGFTQLLAADGDQVLYSGRMTLRWRAGTPPVPFAPAASFADVAHDLLFVDSHKAVGPTSLSAPGAPAWTAAFAPRAVSPDGRWVAGYTASSIYQHRRRLEIRSMADGSLQPTTGLLLPPDAALVWEDGDHLLAEVHGDQGNALVRCTAAGQCERATDWLGDHAITVPYQPEFFFDWP